ncbi:MAG: DNA ligase D [Rhodospirillaceae bacterium]|nr:DNA ligase D [Rhodospirillaceae bacterium]
MDRLTTYRAKRHFDRTTEPEGKLGKPSRGGLYVIHEHDATRLHYDLRLEHEGVLLSWAVTRGPSLDPEEKRLAVQVEDHPIDYGSFEGLIPEGNYGAGTVSQWDRGRWIPEGDTTKALKKGHLTFRLEGEKLKGDWHLVRMRRRPKEKRDNWLLIKSKDEYAVPGAKGEIVRIATRSVKTGRTLAEIAEGRKAKPKPRAPAARKTAKKSKAAKTDKERPRRGSANPAFVPPCLARLDKTPAGADWLHEVKFDGYRMQAVRQGGKVALITRTGLDWTKRFGSAIKAALQELPCSSAVIDGEIVVLADTGVSDFSALQADLSEGRASRFVFYAFDLLHLDGADLSKRRLVERKEALEELLGDKANAGEGALRYSQHFVEDGDVMLDQACRLGLEGVVSKRRDAPYRSGRSGDWIKSKCIQRQEFVVTGYVPSTATRNAVGSLLVGYHENGRLRPAGRVGTGYSATVARDLKRRLDTIKADRSPYEIRQPGDNQVKWAKPELVAEVEFRAWTAEGILRHAAFVGLREDKPAAEIGREGKATEAAAGAKAKSRMPKTKVNLSHPDRVLWPEAGLSKQGLLDHYAAVWDLMKPYVVDRPLALLRAPGGIGGSQLFFQKHRSPGMHQAIGEIKDPKDGEGLIVIRDFDGLAALVQFGVVEIHLWGSSADTIEKPDQMIFDLDPDKGVDWNRVVEAAEEIRRRLIKVKLVPFLKTSGGKGLHVVVPLKPDADWTRVKDFSKALAEHLARDFPDRYTANMSKKMRPGKIFVDYLRNGRGATAVAPYSTRARGKAPVAVPIAWEELGLGVRADQFRVDNLMNRLDHLKNDPWAGFRKAARPLPKKS